MPESFNLQQFLPYQLARISERVSDKLAEEYGRTHGLSVAEWRVLVNLQMLGTVSVRDIGQHAALEKSRVSRAVDRLVRSGLVAKQASTKDARLVEIALTDQGSTTLNAIFPAAIEFEDQLMDGLTEAQKRTFAEVIEHFHRALDSAS